MKSKFNLLALIFTFAMFFTAAGEEKSKDYNESWKASSVESLSIVNKYGKVEVINSNSSEVTIDVVVTVNASTQSKAAKQLDKIDVIISKNGKAVKAVTNIDSDFRNMKDFNIDYTVKIPSDKALDISNKFGNTIVESLNAKGNFNIEYGAFNAGSLIYPGGEININMKYSKVSSIEELSDANITMGYSTIKIGKAGKLKLTSKYSVLTIEELASANIASKYDTYNLEEIASLKVTSKYSHFNIEELGKILKVESGYGSIKVEEVGDDFELIDIDNSYGSVRLGIGENVSYNINASCRYCGVDYDKSNFKGNRMKENNKTVIEGQVGSGNATAKVLVTSKYGSIRLR